MSITLTRDQVRRVDGLAVERYGMSGLVLMENAGRNAAAIIQKAFPDSSRAVVVCGTGNNGGDGFVIARHLHNAGWTVRTVLTGSPARLTPDAAANHRIVQVMGLPVEVAEDRSAMLAAMQGCTSEDILIDAVLGTGFQGEVRSPLAELIVAVNAASKRATVAVDVPSGLDCATGQPAKSTVRADLTITFVARKSGFDAPLAKEYLGRIEIADIGCPRALIDEVQRTGV